MKYDNQLHLVLQWTKSKYLQKSISEQVNYEWVAEQLHFALNTEIKF